MSSISTSPAGGPGVARRIRTRTSAVLALLAAIAVVGMVVVALVLVRAPQRPTDTAPAPRPVTEVDQGCVSMRGPC
jgi:hypothetical protein